ncbi:diguanylate cyclase [Marinomonas sp.]
MVQSYEFLKCVLDSIQDHIVVIDNTGEIQLVNRSWASFGEENACTVKIDWQGMNYLDECDKAANKGDEFAQMAGAGIRSVIAGQEPAFYYEYPCHSPEEKRWFMMRVTPFEVTQHRYFVVAHQNITERKLAEKRVQALARMDGLTNVPNRRTFDEFFKSEWQRCLRLKKPISLAIIDLDFFKLVNDTYGHQAGDDCLRQVATLLSRYAKRPSDICARYGGEEFIILWADQPLDQAKRLSEDILYELGQLKIDNVSSSVAAYLTASIGVAQMFPDHQNHMSVLLERADLALYQAKDEGRNRVKLFAL